MHYYILEAAILGSSHVCFFILVDGSACAQASAMTVPQGLGTGVSQLILPWASQPAHTGLQCFSFRLS